MVLHRLHKIGIKLRDGLVHVYCLLWYSNNLNYAQIPLTLTSADFTEPMIVENGPSCPLSEVKTEDGPAYKDGHSDKLVCGRCSAEFLLKELHLFFHHKENECVDNLTSSLVRDIQTASAVSIQYQELEVTHQSQQRKEEVEEPGKQTE